VEGNAAQPDEEKVAARPGRSQKLEARVQKLEWRKAGIQKQTTSTFAVLAQRMERCRECGLPEGVSAVFGRFDSPCWMPVGQAPGKKEVVLGRPFAGAAGRRLFQ
jgi:hypothetical protein